VKLFGWTIARTRDLEAKALLPVDNRGGWWPIIKEHMPGAWQANVTVHMTDALQYWALFRCVSLISGDVSKCRLRLVEQDSDGIWRETTSPAFSPVLRKPNPIQTRIQFFQNWMESKLTRGNSYVLKVRDARDVVVGLRILDPTRVTPLVSDSGDVFYRLNRDNVTGVESEGVIAPADEIIHDRWNTFYHPLLGLSPIYAIGINALAGLRAEQNSARFFGNGARPSGVLTAPAAISDATAARAKAYWDENFTGENAGKVAVLGDGLKYEPMTMSAVDAQLIEQLKWNDTTIAGAYGVPAYMINAGTAPAYNNVEALSQQYYSQCLQIHFEAIEVLLDEGLGLTEVTGKTYGVEFDLNDLLRMDTAAKIKAAVEGVKGVFKPNEVRRWFDLPPVTGGDAVLTQQQNYSLEALAKRDAKDDPFGGNTPPAAAEPDDEEEDGETPAAANDNDRASAAFAAEAREFCSNAIMVGLSLAPAQMCTELIAA
jgi:HK97 family phage portal protein